jgi:hypothetical protein
MVPEVRAEIAKYLTPKEFKGETKNSVNSIYFDRADFRVPLRTTFFSSSFPSISFFSFLCAISDNFWFLGKKRCMMNEKRNWTGLELSGSGGMATK